MAAENNRCDRCMTAVDADEEWKASVVRNTIGALLIVLSMLGIYLDIDYSGWVMFAGIMMVL